MASILLRESGSLFYLTNNVVIKRPMAKMKVSKPW